MKVQVSGRSEGNADLLKQFGPAAASVLALPFVYALSYLIPFVSWVTRPT
jgi:hypothetical protein